MKIFKVLLVVAIALGMMACNNEDVVDLSNLPESTISVRVVPGSDGPAVRSIGDLTGNGVLAVGLPAESAIKQLEVFVFAGETPAGYKSESGENVTQVLDIATTTGERSIFVVANADIGPVANKTTLLAKTKDIPADIENGLPMTSDETTVTLVAGKNQYGFTDGGSGYDAGANQLSVGAPLKVYRVNARVAIVGATLDLEAEDQALFDNLREVQVAMFNVPKTSKLFGSALSLAMNANYLYGKAWDSPLGTYQKDAPAAENASFLDETVTFPITAAAAPHYYVNENTASEAGEQMFIVLRGKTYKGDNPIVAEGYFTDKDGYTYYPVWINATKDGYTYVGTETGDSQIRRNTQYNITLTIKHKGNPNIDPPVSAILDVNVNVEPWLVVTQNVEW
ncbi:MAG: fimbrial protein [Bacteroidota bacterium]|jgi:hypothetical protein|nr:fimbria major subunit [Fermentimonas sp.]MDI9625900.1 fimbrial protein [Bacteroidota bacterium]